MSRFFAILSALLFASLLTASDAAPLPAEVNGFSGTITGTVVNKKAGNLALKVVEAVADAGSKISDTAKLKDTEVSLTPQYDKDGDKWVMNPEQAAAIKELKIGAKVAVQVKTNKKGTALVIAAVPKADGSAKPEQKPETKPEQK